METPIAEYREQRIEGKRHFLLYSDHVRIEGTEYLKSECQLKIPLNQLNSEPNDHLLIAPTFKAGLWLMVPSLALLTFLAGSPLGPSLEPLMAFLLALAAAGLIMAFVARRRVRYKSFQNLSGQTVLDIALTKGSEEEFESFVTAAQSQIHDLT